MSRWFRHYAGMARDDKLVRASIKSKQSIERVVWVWSAILESATEIDDGGRYEIDHAEMARFLRCPASKLADIEDALCDLGRIDAGCVAKWHGRQFQSDRSAARTKRYRDNLKGRGDGRGQASRDAHVTSHERHCDAPETETETDIPFSNENGPKADPEKQFWDDAKSYLSGASKNPGALIGKWHKTHDRQAIREAITRSQVERAMEPVSFIEGCLRQRRKADEWVSPC